MSPLVWTKNDARFLRSMRISPIEAPLRYLAVAGVDGWWHVIDLADQRKRIRHFGRADSNAMQAACDAAGELNRSNVAK